MVDGNLKYAMLISVKAAERTSNNVIKSIILIVDSSKDKSWVFKRRKVTTKNYKKKLSTRLIKSKIFVNSYLYDKKAHQH